MAAETHPETLSIPVTLTADTASLLGDSPAERGGRRRAPPAGESLPLRDFKLSVLIPVYNEKATILEILRRVLAVEISMEVIVVDDGSTDGTRELLAGEVG